MYKKPRCKEYARGAFFVIRKLRSYYIKKLQNAAESRRHLEICAMTL